MVITLGRQRPIDHNIITFPTPSVSAGASRCIDSATWLAVLVTGFDDATPPSVQLKTCRVCAFASSAGHTSKEHRALATAAD